MESKRERRRGFVLQGFFEWSEREREGKGAAASRALMNERGRGMCVGKRKKKKGDKMGTQRDREGRSKAQPENWSRACHRTGTVAFFILFTASSSVILHPIPRGQEDATA